MRKDCCRLVLSALAAAAAFALVATGVSRAAEKSADQGEEATKLAKETQNPVANLISVPFQNNFNFNTGTTNTTQWVLNVQPVIPIPLGHDWNLITRTIMPIINQPGLFSGGPRTEAFGLGDINPTMFFSPAKPGKFIWGVGPTMTLPTATVTRLGSGRWSAGPAAVGLLMEGPWVAGALVNQQWDFAGWSDKHVNSFLMQPFVNYNLAHGWYLTSAPTSRLCASMSSSTSSPPRSRTASSRRAMSVAAAEARSPGVVQVAKAPSAGGGAFQREWRGASASGMSAMTVDAWIMVAILAGLFALLAWDRFPTWLVVMGTLTACMTFQLAPPDALLKGFGNVGVVTVAALFPVAAGMYSTGAITLLSQHVIGQPRTLGAAQLKILPPITIGSGFLNNTPLVAMMIPIIRDLARTTGLAPSKLLMGISFASILGGTITLIGTSVNLIVAGLTANAIASGQLHGMTPLSLFAPIWVGLPVSVAGVLFLIVIGTRLLPGERQRATPAGARRWYRVEFRIEPRADLDGKTLEAAGFAQPTGYRLLSVSRKGQTLPIAPDLRLQGEDHLAMAGPVDGVAALWATAGLLPAFGNLILTERYRNQLVELVVSPRAPAVGRLASEVPVPESPYRAAVVGVSHDGQPPEEPLDQYRVQAGDAGILEVPESFFYENRLETDFVLIKAVSGYEVQRVNRAVVALGITGAMMALTAFNVTTMLNAALLATGAMLVTGCLTIQRAWESVDWRTVVTLGAAVGLEPALTQSGLSAVSAQLLSSIAGNSAMLALTVVFMATLLATNIIGHAAAAVLMFPVALSMANRLGVSFMPFAIILMMGASCAFINPAGFQTNLMVQGPGGYSFGDYAKVGVPLTVLVAVVALLIVPVAYGF